MLYMCLWSTDGLDHDIYDIGSLISHVLHKFWSHGDMWACMSADVFFVNKLDGDFCTAVIKLVIILYTFYLWKIGCLSID